MTTEINVARKGRHYFRVVMENFYDFNDVKEVFYDVRKRFPESEGFELSVTEWNRVGKVCPILGNGELQPGK